MGSHTGQQFTLFRPDLHQAFSLDHVVDLIGSLMLVCRLFLSRFKAVDVTEHPLGFKEINLLEFVGCKALRLRDVYPSHDHSPLWMRSETDQPFGRNSPGGGSIDIAPHYSRRC